MKTTKGNIIVWTILCLLTVLVNIDQAYSQVYFTEPDTTGKQVIIDSSRVLRFINGVKQLVGEVALRQDDARMFCDSAAIIENNVRAYGNVIIQQGDSVFVFSDTLFYYGDTRLSTLLGEVVLTDSVQTLYTERLDYDLNTKIGNYQTGGQLVNKSTVLKSARGYYHVNEKQAYFSEAVEVVDTNYTLSTDTLKIDTETQITTFLAPTSIVTSDYQIYCEEGFFDTQNNYAEFEKNARYLKDEQEGTAEKIIYYGDEDRVALVGGSQIKEEGRTMQAESTDYDAENEVTYLTGNVVIQDSVQTIKADTLKHFGTTNKSIATGNVIVINEEEEFTVYCETGEYNDETGYLKASGRPYMVTLVDGDSLWLSADTLYSFKDQEKDSFRILIADEDVRMFKADLQSISDSLIYSTKSETFRFFENPVLWSDTSQFTADTITVYMVDKVINRINLYQNAFIINTNDSVFFNQVKGREIIARFSDNELRRMNVLGNGESVYYVEDDGGAYVGVNKTICSEMLVYFGNNKVGKITFYQQPQATIYPMGQVGHRALRMEGFKWLENKRPKSKDDLRYYKVE
ncbi:MAG: OstA-like protein [Bacteroidota bacterium]